MPIKVYYQNDPSQICSIRPTPFVQISEAILKNKEGTFGATYTITLTGTLLPDRGTPYALNSATNQIFDFIPGQTEPASLVGPYEQFDNVPLSSRDKPPRQQIIYGTNPNIVQNTKPASALLSKQRALRALFAQDGQKVVISDILDNAGATVVCYPRTVSIDFTEGQYITKCEYTIVLEADYLLRGLFDDDQLLVDYEGTFANSGVRGTDVTIQTLLDSQDTAFIETYSEDWGLEADDQAGESLDNPITYRISHSLNATGKTVYGPDGLNYNFNNGPNNVINIPAWEQAKRFVQKKLANGGSGLPYPNIMGQIGSGTVDLLSSYGGYNHIRTEQINVTDGTYSVTENWILASGKSTETYNMSTSTSSTDPFVTVQIDGNIKGLRNISPVYGSGLGDPAFNAVSGAYANALSKYNQISNSGKFGLTSDVYKRANNLVAVELNSQPVSVSLGTNQYNGEITYSLSFNNRPTNIISGVIAESIQVNDTYPGDIFAIIPVIGRATGPILQSIGGRTEYKRDVSINLTMDYTKIPYGDKRNTLILKKPSLVEPTASQIAGLINELSPKGEPGVRKYFISPPTESWSPKEGTYSFNISWTYEMDK
jgi:hypothetical protein